MENYKEAFDLTAFHQRFSEILNKFDYIVGDWGNEQLRLRGFYRDEKAKENAEKISRLQDYLLEYCNYGCAYFVLENAQPRRAAFDKNPTIRENRMAKNIQKFLGNVALKKRRTISKNIVKRQTRTNNRNKANRQSKRHLANRSAILSFVRNKGMKHETIDL